MKRSILISLLILILLVPLVANTDDNTIPADSESLVLSGTDPAPVAEEQPILTEDEENTTTPIVQEEPLLITENEESTTSLEVLEGQLPPKEESPAGKEVVVIPAGNTTVSGVNGYIVVPSAEPVPGGKGTSITTGYSGIFSTEVYAHVPFIQMGFSDIAEVSLAVDIDAEADLLLNAKWRFSHRKGTSLALGLVGQLIDVSTRRELAAQLYLASTFSSSIMDFPSKTTVLLGYTFHKDLNTNIDFGIAFQTPFFPSAFKDKMFFLLDFGNVSYSVDPSAGDADNRGLVNVGLRMAPLKVLNSVYLTAELRALDLFDHKGRALSLGFTLAFRPDKE